MNDPLWNWRPLISGEESLRLALGVKQWDYSGNLDCLIGFNGDIRVVIENYWMEKVDLRVYDERGQIGQATGPQYNQVNNLYKSVKAEVDKRYGFDKIDWDKHWS